MEDETKTVPSMSVKILKKLHEIQKEIERMEKGGYNKSQDYNYLGETQIAEVFKPLLEKHEVMFTYGSAITAVHNSPSGKQLVTDVAVQYRFIDVKSGEYIEGQVAGQGADATDKGVYKAITGAVKYIFLKTFLIPTGDDPENDSRGRATGAKTPSAESIPFGDEED